MGKIEDLRITCGDKQNPVYRPGDTIFGKVTFRVVGDISVRVVRLYCYGKALTKWAVSGQRSFQSDSRAKEDYMARQFTFFGGDGTTTLKEGDYSYNYKFELPRENLPSSFEGELGAIRYWLKFSVEKPFPGIDFDRYKPFNVLGTLDVNEYNRRVSKKESKTLSKALGIGNAGELSLSFSLNRSAYCPGEQMLVNLEAINNSTKDLGFIHLRLVQRAWYSVGTENDMRTSVVKSIVSTKKLPKQDKIEWKNHVVEIPPIPPSTVERSCHIIEVYYFVEVEVEVPMGLNLSAKLNVKIGTVPFGAKKVESKKQHSDCKNYTRIGFTKAIVYKACTKGVETCSKTDSDLPFPYISHTPLTAFVNPSAAPPSAKTQTTAKPTTASATKPSAAAVNNTTPKTPLTTPNTNTPTPTATPKKTLPTATVSDSTAPRATPTAPPPQPHPTLPFYPQGINPYVEFPGEAMAMAMPMPFPNEAPPAYDSVYNTTYNHNEPAQPAYTPMPNITQGNPKKATAQSPRKVTTAAAPSKTSSATASALWKGAIVGTIFPDTELKRMKDFIDKNPKILDANGGKVLITLEKFQIPPSEQTSLLVVLFKSQADASQWAQHLTVSNPVSDVKIFIAENASPSTTELKNYDLFPHVSAVLTCKDPTKPRSKEQSEQLTAFFKSVIQPCRTQYGGKSVLVSSKLQHISGDWAGTKASPENMSVSITTWPNKELYEAFLIDLKSQPEYETFLQLHQTNQTTIGKAAETRIIPVPVKPTVATQENPQQAAAAAVAPAVKTPSASAPSGTWKGVIVGSIFLDTELARMKEFVSSNQMALDANGGRILTILDKFRISPSDQTSLLVVLFKSHPDALQWAHHMSGSNPGSNPVPDMKVFIAVNTSPSTQELKNYDLYPHVNVVMTCKDPTKPLPKEQSGKLAALSKTVIYDSRTQYGGKSIFNSSKLQPISGDWSGFTCPPENMSVSMSAWPNKDLYDAYVKDLKTKPDYEKFDELIKFNSTTVASANSTLKLE